MLYKEGEGWRKEITGERGERGGREGKPVATRVGRVRNCRGVVGKSKPLIVHSISYWPWFIKLYLKKNAVDNI